ncbi:MAG TPA: SRPBCC domain-containing protein [Propionibacteriaceae bacterium]|nr:SRPBCC domain-containing protein [Propionibacteriaceae bacterium]
MSEQTTSEATGETQDAAVVVSRLVSHPLKSVWKVVMTDDGNEALLGPGARLGDKGHTWHAADGTTGVTRSFHPLEQIRFSWHKDDASPSTIVDLHFSAVSDHETQLELVHDHLSGDIDREWLAAHWSDALERIDHDALD